MIERVQNMLGKCLASLHDRFDGGPGPVQPQVVVISIRVAHCNAALYPGQPPTVFGQTPQQDAQ